MWFGKTHFVQYHISGCAYKVMRRDAKWALASSAGQKRLLFLFFGSKAQSDSEFLPKQTKKINFPGQYPFYICVWIFGAWHTQQTSQKVRKKVFNWSEVHLYHSNFLQNPYLTTIPVEPGFLWHFVRLSLKTCSLYHEKLFIQKFKDISSQVLNNFFSASDIMEAVRGRFGFYGMKVAWFKSHIVAK